MKYTITALSLLLANPVFASSICIKQTQYCDQQTYDDLYKAIFVKLVTSQGTVNDYADKRRALGLLRKLCRGQKSTHELPKCNFTIEDKY